MVLAETLIYFFVFMLGAGALYMSSIRKRAVMWPVLAFGFFMIGVLYGSAIPFATNASGEVIGTPANMVLAGLSFMFAIFAFFKLILTIFDILKG